MIICIIADQIYKSGGIERVLSHRINHWIDEGYQIHLITSQNDGNEPYFYYDSRMIHHDITTSLDTSISLFSRNNLIAASRYFFRLKNALNKIKPEVIIMTNYSYDYYFLPLIARNAYCIKEYHSSFSEKNNLIEKLKKFYAKFYDSHVFLSEEEAVLSSTPNAVVIPNPIIHSINYPNQMNERKKVILAAGRIVSIKGFERLIESWSRIANKYPEWHLEIYGDGEPSYIKLLKDLIEEKDIAANTNIYPSTPHINKKMLESRIYAMSSLSECFPMVLLEAMCSKMAVIAFDCPTGPRNILKDNYNGILVKDNDIINFTKSLERLIKKQDFAQRIADNGYVESQKYDIRKVMEKWSSLVN